MDFYEDDCQHFIFAEYYMKFLFFMLAEFDLSLILDDFRFRDQNLTENTVVNAFLKKFQISREELALLNGEDGNVFLTYEIFSILDKLQNIHNECKTLMQSGLQTLGLGLMEQIKLYQVRNYINQNCL